MADWCCINEEGHLLKRSLSLGSRDGSVDKSTGYSSRGPEFNSQQPHGGSQPSVVGSDVLFCHKGVHADRALIAIK